MLFESNAPINGLPSCEQLNNSESAMFLFSVFNSFLFVRFAFNSAFFNSFLFYFFFFLDHRFFSRSNDLLLERRRIHIEPAKHLRFILLLILYGTVYA